MPLPKIDELESGRSRAISDRDPTAYLLADHAWLRLVLDAYQHVIRSAEGQAQVRDQFEAFEDALDLHIRLEEDVYFPAVETVMEELGQGSTFDMYGEHDAIRIRMGELLEALSDGRGSPDAFAALKRSLVIHFENEEELIFAEVPPHLTPEEGGELLDRMLEYELKPRE
jgi:hypothetical protein